jgi:nicotinamide-nucleotide amidase
MKAEIIAIGSELLTPHRVDTNSLFLTERLNRLGIEVTRKVVVGDRREHLAGSFREALERVELVMAMGGLGPTEDDLTREALCDVLGRKLIPHDGVMRAIEERFRRFARPMAENNRKQALVPEGASVLENQRGTAPGLWLEEGGRIVVLLPGPPNELQAMWPQAEQRLERLGAVRGGVRLYSRELRVAGMPESEAERRVAPIYTQYAGAQTTILASPGEVQLHLRVWSADPPAAAAMLNEMAERMALALGESLFTRAGESLEEVVANALNAQGATVAVAESCTAGLVAERLTRLGGSSTYFLGGVVCYSNELKSSLVDVPPELIEVKGAVSAEVAVALAQGIRRRAGATLGVGITGIAGPGGGSAEKPVGLVHIALSNGAATKERRFHFPGDRERVRWQASQLALDMIRRYFLFAGQEGKK